MTGLHLRNGTWPLTFIFVLEFVKSLHVVIITIVVDTLKIDSKSGRPNIFLINIITTVHIPENLFNWIKFIILKLLKC
jgi:hypothetical protein